MHLWLLVTFFLICQGIPESKSDGDISKTQTNGNDERVQLLKDNLNLGYHLSNIDVRRNKKIPQVSGDLTPEYLISLYKSYLESHAIDLTSVVDDDKFIPQPRKSVVCLPSGVCFDLDNPLSVATREIQNLDDSSEDDSEESEEKVNIGDATYDNLIPQPRENIVCFPNGVCIDLDDPGVHPKYQL